MAKQLNSRIPEGPVAEKWTNYKAHQRLVNPKNKLKLDHDHLIKDWEQAGLDKPSIARADRIIEIPREYTGTAGRIGKLSETDVRALTFILQEIADSH